MDHRFQPLQEQLLLEAQQQQRLRLQLQLQLERQHVQHHTYNPYYPRYELPHRQPHHQQSYPHQLPHLAATPAVVSQTHWTGRPMFGQLPYRDGGALGGDPFGGHQVGYRHLISGGGVGASFIEKSHDQGRGGSYQLSQPWVPSVSLRPEPLVPVDSRSVTKQVGYRHLISCGEANPSLIEKSQDRDRGGSYHLSQHWAPSASLRPEPSVAVDSRSITKQAGVQLHPPRHTDQALPTLKRLKPESTSTLESEVPNYQNTHPPVAQNGQMARCEICNALCANLDVLEKHQNGKRHRKNLKRIEDMKNGIKTRGCRPDKKMEVAHPRQCEHVGEDNETTDKKIEEMKNGIRIGGCRLDKKMEVAHPRQCEQVGEDKKTTNKKIEDMKNGIRIGGCRLDKKMEVAHPRQCEQIGEDKKATDSLPSEGVGFEKSTGTVKQNQNPGQAEVALGGGSENVKRGKKRKKRNSSKPPVDPSKPKVVVSLYCDLCNAKCDTQAILNRHLSGKRHIARSKRFSGRKDLYRPVGLQVLYPHNPMVDTIFLPQEGKYMPPHVYKEIPVETSSDLQLQQNSIFQGSESIP